jgi:DNA-binding Lrp family transcriptional regulator
MASPVTDEIDVIDDLDRTILHALQLNGRAPFSLLGDVLGVSEQTVARRYRRMHAAGVVRVVGLVDPAHAGQLDWMVRITCRPAASGALAAALARRTDVMWVSLTGAGNEIMASLRAGTEEVRNELLLQRLPQTEQVLDLSAGLVLHRFTGRYDRDWRLDPHGLEPDQVVALADSRAGDRSATPMADSVARADLPTTDDKLLLAALASDGRTPIPALADATGWSPGRVRRRLDTLLGNGSVYLDVDLSLAALGLPLLAMLWLTVEPQHLDAFGTALGTEDSVVFAAATTGPFNLSAAVALTGVDALYQFTNHTGTLAAGLRQLEVAPVIQRIKQAGSLVDGSRLLNPALPATKAWRPPRR